MDWGKNFYIAYIVWNVIVFLVYGFDKYNAIHQRWRISEKTLLKIAFCMGGLGAFLGMQIFRHKTKHKEFVTLVPIFMLLNYLIIFYAKKTGVM